MKDISLLIGKPRKPKNWIVQDLILQGDQILITAPPKAGKSLLGSQLALCATTGHQFLRWLIPTPIKVLYFNLEVNEDIFVERFEMQANSLKLTVPPGMMLFDSELRTFDISCNIDFSLIQSMIKDSQASLVFFDVLSRAHDGEENSNTEMKRILLHLRQVCDNVASVVVHHNRKAPQGMEGANLGPSSIRGASAVHGEVDLAITLAKDEKTGLHSLRFSARNIREPDEMFLKLAQDSLLFSETTKPQPAIAGVLQNAFQMSPRAPVSEIQKYVADALGIDQRQVQRHLSEAARQKLISAPIRDGKNYYYEVGDRNKIDCFDEMPKAA